MLDASRDGFGPSFGRGCAEARLRGKEGICRWFLARYDPSVEEGRVRRWYMSATEIESGKREEERVRKENVAGRANSNRPGTPRHSSANFPERLAAPGCGAVRCSPRFTG